MVDSRVDTISRLAQWRIDSLGPCNFKKSDPFKVGIWNWHLSVEKSRYLHVRLFPEPSKIAKEQPPIARFFIRVSSVGPNRRPSVSPTLKLYSLRKADGIEQLFHEKLLRTSEDFVWAVDSTFHGRFIVDVEFLDLKICPMNGGEASSIWPMEGTMQSVSSQSTLQCLSRMLDEAIYADVTIKTIDGTLQAHKAILSASSLVFKSMFHHNLKEKESSIIFIEDMTLEACMALLRYLYGTITEDNFWKHRLSLLGAANKYGIVDLKDACEESLLEDINSGNVLGRLQEAWLYQLHKLKKGCLAYLFDFGKVYDLRDEINDFFRQADRELMMEMFQEVLTVWKPV
ncbi:BTB/POZ domain-containing protein At1g21780 isoform X2 [Benincasa hispida]|uniref:BTB/POZ domain-containing protein At1g21780 isoform X2 n=1 Tax=Benincasa hispida TaxID=102211 RepID=UPI0018FFEEE5|nr:BTB/POZ domain-containing protein At1g21780 isoform X2 [Benincasa hispida]